jgi:hypothetical protein
MYHINRSEVSKVQFLLDGSRRRIKFRVPLRLALQLGNARRVRLDVRKA